MKFTRFFFSRPREKEKVHVYFGSFAIYNPYKYSNLLLLLRTFPLVSKTGAKTEMFQRFTLAAASWIRRLAVGC